MSSEAETNCDVVLEGGGPKGIGLVGALEVLEAHKYRVHRVGGTSGGAVVGCLLAAGMTAAQLADEIFDIDYKKFADTDAWNRLPLLGDLIAIACRSGIHPGREVEQWLTKRLGEQGVKTFGDLRIAGDDAPMEERYRFVAVVSDVSARRLVHLPWEYGRYGLDPDQQSVAAAVRASSSIPYYFRPVTLRGKTGASTFVDGGLLSNFPVDIFDRKGAEPRWPTFGIKLSARPDATRILKPARGPIGLLTAMVLTGLNAHDQIHLDDPAVLARTMFVDTHTVSQFDFDITRAQQELLFANGQAAATRFLGGWDWGGYVAAHRSGPAPAPASTSGEVRS